MAHLLYPTPNDLKMLLDDSGTPVNGSLFGAALDASIANFEKEVNWHMLAGRNSDNSERPATTREFYQEWMVEEQQGMIQLNLGPFGGIARIDSVVFQIPNAAAQTLQEFTDWWRMPVHADDEGQPWTWLRVLPYATLFFGLLPLYNAKIQVTGLWGWPKLPGDAWLAMLYGAAMIYFEGSWVGLRTGLFNLNPIKSWTSPGGVQTVYNTSWWAERREVWGNAVNAALDNYRRLSIA